ncbi:MAG: hypothetical protein IKI67_05830 [Bacteroidales bacterium]|nr:hypothetical protein [Bacteroidales bacterium]
MKPYFFTASILLFCIYSCSSHQISGETSYVDPTNRQDTVLLGYVLNSPTKKVTDSLIRVGLFYSEEPELENFEISVSGLSSVISVMGFPFELYVDEQKYDAFMKLSMEETTFLVRQEIYIKDKDIPAKYALIDALTRRYGKQTIIPNDYEPILPSAVEAFWNVSNKAIYVIYAGTTILVYEDIIFQQERNKKNREMEEYFREIDRKYNQQNSAKTKL